MLSHYREERRADGSKHYVQTQLQDRKEFISDILSKENTLIYICGMIGMESGVYTEILKQGFDEYLDIRRELPEDLDEIPSDKFSRCVKTASAHLKRSIRSFTHPPFYLLCV